MISLLESKLQRPPTQRRSSPSTDDGLDAAEQLHYELRKVTQNMPPASKFCFQDLPAELIDHILSYLSPRDLEILIQVSKTLKVHSEKDLAWYSHCQSNIPGVILTSPAPCSSYRELYKAHDPHWFLTKWKVWFSDHVYSGRLIIARYNPQNGNIEAYRLVAERAELVLEQWEHDDEVIIHSFEPRVQLHFDTPILNLSALPVTAINRNDSRHFDYHRFSPEIPMRVDARNTHGSFSNFLLARKAGHDVPSNQVWPPMTIPGIDTESARVVEHDQEIYCTERHKPKNRDQTSEHAFRVRQWIEMTAGHLPNRVHLGEEVWTFATLDPKLYTPTQEKLFRGIWIGDYSGHGCEFLLVHQPDDEVSSEPVVRGEGESDDQFAKRQMDNVYRGRLEAIKLTGDPNIPRGEITFVAEDIGTAGFVRYAEEKRFKGARIVKSKGHIAARTFRNDKYIESQLIMISPNRMAQYWVGFGHISFYERVNIDDFIDPYRDGMGGIMPRDFTAFQGAVAAPGGSGNGGLGRLDNVTTPNLN